MKDSEKKNKIQKISLKLTKNRLFASRIKFQFLDNDIHQIYKIKDLIKKCVRNHCN